MKISAKSWLAGALMAMATAFTATPTATAQDAQLSEIRQFAFNFCPRGWARADGQLLAINTNQALYSLLGTTYGGDGRTTFALPNFRPLPNREPVATPPGLTTDNTGHALTTCIAIYGTFPSRS